MFKKNSTINSLSYLINSQHSVQNMNNISSRKELYLKKKKKIHFEIKVFFIEIKFPSNLSTVFVQLFKGYNLNETTLTVIKLISVNL